MDDSLRKSVILYYCREKYFCQMETIALAGMLKSEEEQVFKLYHALALILANRVPQGIQNLEMVESDSDVYLASLLALSHAYRISQPQKNVIIEKLEAKVKELSSQSRSIELYHGAMVYLCLEEFSKAKNYIDRSLANDSPTSESLTARAWIELNRAKLRKGSLTEVQEMFSVIGSESIKSLNALLGETECLEQQQKFDLAQHVVNKAVVRFRNSIPLLRKMRLQLAQRDWDQAQETLMRVYVEDPTNLEAMFYSAYLTVLRSHKRSGENLKNLRDFCKCLETHEPTNFKLFLAYSRMLSVVSAFGEAYLTEVFHYAEKAHHLQPENALVLNEMGAICEKMQRYDNAGVYLRQSAKLNSKSLDALVALASCECAENGVTDQFCEQVEFLKELRGGKAIPRLLYLESKLPSAEPNRLIDEVFDIKLNAVQSLPFGTEFLLVLDPDFMLECCEELMKSLPRFLPPEPVSHLDLKKCRRILEILTTSVPGLRNAHLMLVRVCIATGVLSAALAAATRLVDEVDTTFEEGHLALAQVHLRLGAHDKVMQNLELSLSRSFTIREDPIYHLLHGLVCRRENLKDEALKSILTALELAKGQGKRVNLGDKVTIYLELIGIYHDAGETDEASKLLHEAIAEFQETPEYTRILLFSAELSLKKNDVKGAMNSLKMIKPGQQQYAKAQEKLAEIHLKEFSDRDGYMDCFREIVETKPGVQSLIMLGDAYMRIQEHEEGITAYQEALKLNPQDNVLALKIGELYVKSHQYANAVNYYLTSIQKSNFPGLKIDLAKVYVKLRNFEKAESLLADELESLESSDDVTNIHQKVQYLIILSEIQEKSGNGSGALSTLRKAFDNHSRIKWQTDLDVTDKKAEVSLKDISVRMANLAISLRDSSQAVTYYKRALLENPQDENVLICMAKLYLQMGRTDVCEKTCHQVLDVNPDNETASLMLADLSFNKMDFPSASFHYAQLLAKQPASWTALIRQIEVMRRLGTLEDCGRCISLAEECAVDGNEPGLRFCKGLFTWYSGHPNTALKHFNSCRHDIELGKMAIKNMIEICLNPEDDLFGVEAITSIEDIEYQDSRTMALSTAERLLKEIAPKSKSVDGEYFQYQLLQNFLLLATKQRPNIEKALDEFTLLASNELFKDHVGPILGMSTAHVMLKQQQRARNQLKRVMKSPWSLHDGEYLEKCWVLLADLYIQTAKFDIAIELLKKVLNHNKSNLKAHEYLGFIFEKEQKYKEAAAQYDMAFKFGGKNSPVIGYKLAYNYMKGKRYADALDTCIQVLRVHPDFPKIKKDIYEKSLSSLRT